MSGRNSKGSPKSASFRRRQSQSVRTGSKNDAGDPTPHAELETAMKRHQEGHIAEAEFVYDRLLQQACHHPQLLHLKGVARQQQGDHSSAIEFLSRASQAAPQSALTRFAWAQSLWSSGAPDAAIEQMKKAVSLQPHQVQYRFALAEFLFAAGRDHQTSNELWKVLELDSDYWPAHRLLGNVNWKLGQHAEAARNYRQALRFNSHDAGLQASLGSVLIALNEPLAAVASLQEAVKLDPSLASAHNNLGNALRQTERVAEALVHFEHAIALEPNQAVYFDNRGLARQSLDLWHEAESDYRRAIALDPQLEAAHLHLALLLRERRRTSEALAQFQLASQLAPDDAAAVNGIASCLFDMYRFCEARPFYERALQLAPKSIPTWENLADCACEQGDLELAARCCQRAQELGPNSKYAVRQALRLSPILNSRLEMEARRRELRSEMSALRDSGCRLDSAVHDIRSASFYLAYHGENERDLLSLLGDFYSQADPSLEFVAAHCRHAHQRRKKLRVGFLSRFFCNHSVGLHYGGLIREMNHDDFEVFLLRVTQPDDDIARAIVASADVTVDLSSKFERARQQVAECELDVLVYTDLGMDYFTYFLAFARLAPVQCVLAGHPLTTGIPNVDYFISNDRMEPPDASSHYREQLIRLQGQMTRLERPAVTSSCSNRETWGFSQADHIYICPQTLFKMHPDFDILLGQILRRDPLGKLVLFRAESADWSQLLMKRFEQSMPDVINSIRWLDRVPMADFLGLLRCTDVVLDTIHFNGGTTSMLALGVAAPIVTLPGPYMRGRTTRVCYDWMGYTDLIAHNDRNYVELANELACNPELRATCQRSISELNHALFEGDSVIRELEQVLLELQPRR